MDSYCKTNSDVVCYGTPALILTTRTGKEFLLPKVFSEDIPENLANKFENIRNHYVYVCKLKDRVIYVGKGVGDRIKHCLSGKSSSEELNKLYSDGEPLSVEKVAENLTEEMATHLEESYIRALIKSGDNLLNKALPEDIKQYLQNTNKTIVFPF
jgi:dihydroneopterin aldolase